VDADDALLRHGAQAQRVGVAQVLLVGERQLQEVGLGLDVLRVDAREMFFVELALFRAPDVFPDFGQRFLGHIHDCLLSPLSTAINDCAASPCRVKTV